MYIPVLTKTYIYIEREREREEIHCRYSSTIVELFGMDLQGATTCFTNIENYPCCLQARTCFMLMGQIHQLDAFSRAPILFQLICMCYTVLISVN